VKQQYAYNALDYFGPDHSQNGPGIADLGLNTVQQPVRHMRADFDLPTLGVKETAITAQATQTISFLAHVIALIFGQLAVWIHPIEQNWH
jgi:hypothetical protein